MSQNATSEIDHAYITVAWGSYCLRPPISVQVNRIEPPERNACAIRAPGWPLRLGEHKLTHPLCGYLRSAPVAEQIADQQVSYYEPSLVAPVQISVITQDVDHAIGSGRDDLRHSVAVDVAGRHVSHRHFGSKRPIRLEDQPALGARQGRPDSGGQQHSGGQPTLEVYPEWPFSLAAG